MEFPNCFKSALAQKSQPFFKLAMATLIWTSKNVVSNYVR